ncbi:MAG: hypothetical protein WB290_13245 [Smithella sp.]
MQKILKTIPAIIGGILMFASGIAPNDAVSNISKWADLFHISIPNFLKNKTADIWTFWIVLILTLLYIILIIIPMMTWVKKRVKNTVISDSNKINLSHKETMTELGISTSDDFLLFLKKTNMPAYQRGYSTKINVNTLILDKRYEVVIPYNRFEMGRAVKIWTYNLKYGDPPPLSEQAMNDILNTLYFKKADIEEFKRKIK